MSLRFFTKDYDEVPSFKDGMVLLVDKPSEWTSFDVVNKIRYRLSRIEGVKRFKVGHAGTLDPLATGLLIICVGKYTKKIDEFQGMPKRYSGSIYLGATRPSYDLETEVDAKFPVDHIHKDDILAKARTFIGTIKQRPPIFSAIKSGGERLYKKARRGETVEIKKREITITKFEITHIRMPELDFILDCSKGTYVRSLAFDLGEALNSGAYLSLLRRDKIGEFELKDAWNLEELIEVLDKIQDKVNTDVSRNTGSY